MQAIFDGNKKFAFQITISAFAVNCKLKKLVKCLKALSHG